MGKIEQIDITIPRFTRMVIRLCARLMSNSHRRILVLPVASNGSLGDQAILDVVCTSLSRMDFEQVIVFNHYKDSPPDRLRSAVRIVNAYSNRSLRLFQTLWLCSRATMIAVLGADVIDGSYSPSSIAYKLKLATAVISHGGTGWVTGCSISTHPNARIMHVLRSLPNVPIFAREIVSFERLRDQIGRNPTLSADIAFLLTPQIDSPQAARCNDWIESQRSAGKCILGVNASGPTMTRMGPVILQAYCDVLTKWLLADINRVAVLIPHDWRPHPVGDVEWLRRIHDSLAPLFPERIFYISELISSWEVKALAGKMHAILTGRMHLAIAALGMGVIPICVTYQGKFVGLMSHFKLSAEEVLLEPERFIDTEVSYDLLERIVSRSDEFQKKILTALPRVKNLAQRNFDPASNRDAPDSV